MEVERDLVGKDMFLMMEAASCHETHTEMYIKKTQYCGIYFQYIS